jgi:putative flippase GtrA
MTLHRFGRFNVVSGVGVGVQLATLWLLVHAAGVGYLAATTAAVGAAVAHNFLWHWRWTWRDRAAADHGALGAFRRFVLTNGLTSLVGNLVLTAALVDDLSLRPVAANAVAIAACGLVNFWAADRIVFRGATADDLPRPPSASATCARLL